ncbi:ABC transporter ATP-binding protein [Streptomyces sp. NPDC096311]|uniref:ABC transporter ATP-binding protein n=1 Tax=Streptomyces sp. NPDC096311 TaxID=3366083 RepID=UPI003820A929
MLTVDSLQHTYRSRTSSHEAIADISFSVTKGELVSIVGPSGSGKTTMLHCISGLMPPTGGTVELLGEPVTSVPEGLAMVFQNYTESLFPWLTVESNVVFPLRYRGIDRAERDGRARDALEAVGLTSAAQKYPWQLSGGMQQRVAIARALAYRPSLLLMDEPFASVDAQTREDLEDLVLRVHETYGMTILFITHDIDESVYLADRVLVLSSPPSRILEEIAVPLPRPRDQIVTKGHDDFVRIRTEVARHIRHRDVPVAGAW